MEVQNNIFGHKSNGIWNVFWEVVLTIDKLQRSLLHVECNPKLFLLNPTRDQWKTFVFSYCENAVEQLVPIGS
jgi:hypothetical protein